MSGQENVTVQYIRKQSSNSKKTVRERETCTRVCQEDLYLFPEAGQKLSSCSPAPSDKFCSDSVYEGKIKQLLSRGRGQLARG